MSGEEISTCSWDDSLSLHELNIPRYNSTVLKSSKGRLIQLVHLIDKNGDTILHRAVNNPYCTWDSVEELLLTSDINAKNSLWHTPLHCVIMSNCQKMDVIELLINEGADINAHDRNGSTPLHKAVQNPECSVELIELLIKNRAYVYAKQFGYETPLMLAVRSRNTNLKIIEKLLYKGCLDICAKHTENHSTLRILCNNLPVTRMFLQYSFHVDPDSSEDESIIDFCCSDSSCGFKSLKGTTDRSTDLATSLLIYAVKYPSYNLDIISELLQKGACIYSENCEHLCALDYALRNPNCSLKLIREFFKYNPPGVQWNVIEKGDSFLHIAASNRKCPVEVMHEILEKDKCGNLNQENRYRQTPLDLAADFTLDTDCNLKVVESLLMKGAIISKSSMDLSVLWKNLEVLGSEVSSRDVLECTKLLVKYALIEKKTNVYASYNYIIKTCARFCRRDKYGYFTELMSHLNMCYTEIIWMWKDRVYQLSLYDFALRPECSWHLNEKDEEIYNQQVFKLLDSNWYPLYGNLLVSTLKKTVLEDNIFDVPMHTVNEKGDTVQLNNYCMGHLASFLKNEDLYNLYLAFQKPIDRLLSFSKYMNSYELQKKLHESEEERDCDLERGECSSTKPPNKKSRLH